RVERPQGFFHDLVDRLGIELGGANGSCKSEEGNDEQGGSRHGCSGAAARGDVTGILQIEATGHGSREREVSHRSSTELRSVWLPAHRFISDSSVRHILRI